MACYIHSHPSPRSMALGLIETSGAGVLGDELLRGVPQAHTSSSNPIGWDGVTAPSTTPSATISFCLVLAATGTAMDRGRGNTQLKAA